MGKDFIYVEPSYRVSAWGFLRSKELQQGGSTNLGLRDQRKALESGWQRISRPSVEIPTK